MSARRTAGRVAATAAQTWTAEDYDERATKLREDLKICERACTTLPPGDPERGEIEARAERLRGIIAATEGHAERCRAEKKIRKPAEPTARERKR